MTLYLAAISYIAMQQHCVATAIQSVHQSYRPPVTL